MLLTYPVLSTLPPPGAMLSRHRFSLPSKITPTLLDAYLGKVGSFMSASPETIEEHYRHLLHAITTAGLVVFAPPPLQQYPTTCMVWLRWPPDVSNTSSHNIVHGGILLKMLTRLLLPAVITKGLGIDAFIEVYRPRPTRWPVCGCYCSTKQRLPVAIAETVLYSCGPHLCGGVSCPSGSRCHPSIPSISTVTYSSIGGNRAAVHTALACTTHAAC